MHRKSELNTNKTVQDLTGGETKIILLFEYYRILKIFNSKKVIGFKCLFFISFLLQILQQTCHSFVWENCDRMRGIQFSGQECDYR